MLVFSMKNRVKLLPTDSFSMGTQMIEPEESSQVVSAGQGSLHAQVCTSTI